MAKHNNLNISIEEWNILKEYFLEDKAKPLEDGTYKVEDFFPDDEGLKKFILSFGDQ